MTTPTTDNTADQIISDAMDDACLLPEGSLPSPEQVAKYSRRLNQLVKELMTETQGLWLWQDTPITLVAGQAQYVLGPAAAGGNVANVLVKPADIRDQYYLYSSANGSTRRPVSRMPRVDWDRLSVTTQQGPITQILVDKQQLVIKVNCWLTPDANEATGTLQLVLLNRVTNFVGITDTMSFPDEWALALHWGLAQEICQGQPAAIISRCDEMAQMHKERLIEWDAEQETSITLQPDQRTFRPSRFSK